MIQSTQIQEFVAEAREGHTRMTTRRARRYQRGSICKSQNGEVWYGKYYPAPGAPQKRVPLGRTAEIDEKQARVELDDIVAVLNRNPGQVLGAELVRRFLQQVYIPQKYEDGDWRSATGRDTENKFRRYVLPEIGELKCRDLQAEDLRIVLRKMANDGLGRGTVDKVRFAMGDMVRRMVAEGYLSANIAEGLKTPKAAKPSDRTLLRRATLAEYLRAWTLVEERERLAFDLVTFCGLRASEVYGLRIGDLFEKETNTGVTVQRSWYEAEVNGTKTNETREVGVDAEIFARLTAWTATLPERSAAGWLFPGEQIVTPLSPDEVLRSVIHPRLEPLGLGWMNFAVLRRSHSTLHQERGTDPKIIADQQGHGLGVHLSDYVDTSLARKQEASSALWQDFKALQTALTGSNRDK